MSSDNFPQITNCVAGQTAFIIGLCPYYLGEGGKEEKLTVLKPIRNLGHWKILHSRKQITCAFFKNGIPTDLEKSTEFKLI